MSHAREASEELEAVRGTAGAGDEQGEGSQDHKRILGQEPPQEQSQTQVQAPSSKEPIIFRACLAKRQSALLINGEGDRTIVTFEATGVDAMRAMAVMTYAGDEFNVMVFPVNHVPDMDSWRKLEDETKKAPARVALRVGRRRTAVR